MNPEFVNGWMIEAPFPLKNPVTLEELPLAIQLNVDKRILDCKTILVAPDEQIDEVVTELVIAGFGFTVRITFCERPGGQPQAVGKIV